MSLDLAIRPARNLLGALRLPGDKSISHRYAILSALAEGESRLENFATGADCASTLACLRALGCEVKQEAEGTLTIRGRGPQLSPPQGPLECGNSGSTMRMLAGILAAQPFSSDLVGDASLSRRPMARVIEPLTRMGAAIAASGGARPPLRISGARLRGIDYALPVPSAQVKTAVLFAGLMAQGETSVSEPVPTRDHGELALEAFGARLTCAPGRISIRGGQALRPVAFRIPGDISTAAFFLCAAALFPESNLVLDDVLLNPTRSALLDVLSSLGARFSMLNVEDRMGELAGTIRLEPRPLGGARISGAPTVALIDELPVLAAIAPYTGQGIEIRDAAELRVKESDRIAAVARNLRALGAEVEEFTDGLRVPGRQPLKGGEVDSFGDHRIAMAFAVAALRAQDKVVIRNADAAQVSFPEFFETLEQLVER
ncbi:MAG TPA: 3-phosphoshikimate 1-carboxyvinyltransferase [Terriglobales bacterium]|nr:3-phosphoshikimate 1-carboxyvinyltransferase [Terriglobales bacterium]